MIRAFSLEIGVKVMILRTKRTTGGQISRPLVT